MLEQREAGECLVDYFGRLYGEKNISFGDLLYMIDEIETCNNELLNDEVVARAVGKEYAEFMDFLYIMHRDEIEELIMDDTSPAAELIPYISHIASLYKNEIWDGVVHSVENSVGDDFLDALRYYGDQMLEDAVEKNIGSDLNAYGIYAVHCGPSSTVGCICMIGVISRRKAIEDALKLAVGTNGYATFALEHEDKRVVYGFVVNDGRFGIIRKEHLEREGEMKGLFETGEITYEYDECEPYDYDDDLDDDDEPLDSTEGFDELSEIRFS